LWHFSEDPSITVFAPVEEFVWAIDTRHAPTFWFPRDCPRACAWASPTTSAADLERFFGWTSSRRIHVIEQAWLPAVQACSLYAYRLPEDSFSPHSVGGYWVSSSTVAPLEVVEVGDLLARHAAAGIELRISPSVWPWWTDVVSSTLDFSGSRLRNCTVPMPPELAQL
jgi:hypothetical protein